MSQENLDLVRAGYDAFNRRDFDAAIELGHDDLTWRPLFSVETELLRGKQEVRAAWERQLEVLDIRIEILELIELDEDRVLAVAKWTGEGSASGIHTEQIAAQIATIEDGKLRSVESYPSRQAAIDSVSRAD